MQTPRIVTLSICAVLLCFPGQALMAQGVAAQQSASSSMSEEMLALQKAYLKAEERGDADYVKNALADNFTSIEINGDISGKDDVVRYMHPSERHAPSPILYDFKVVELDSACFVVTYNAVFPGDRLERYQHLSDTWVKQDGQWKLKFQQSTLNLWSAHDLD